MSDSAVASCPRVTPARVPCACSRPPMMHPPMMHYMIKEHLMVPPPTLMHVGMVGGKPIFLSSIMGSSPQPALAFPTHASPMQMPPMLAPGPHAMPPMMYHWTG